MVLKLTRCQSPFKRRWICIAGAVALLLWRTLAAQEPSWSGTTKAIVTVPEWYGAVTAVAQEVVFELVSRKPTNAANLALGHTYRYEATHGSLAVTIGPVRGRCSATFSPSNFTLPITRGSGYLEIIERPSGATYRGEGADSSQRIHTTVRVVCPDGAGTSPITGFDAIWLLTYDEEAATALPKVTSAGGTRTIAGQFVLSRPDEPGASIKSEWNLHPGCAAIDVLRLAREGLAEASAAPSCIPLRDQLCRALTYVMDQAVSDGLEHGGLYGTLTDPRRTAVQYVEGTEGEIDFAAARRKWPALHPLTLFHTHLH